jgi:hypothetical protein
MSVNVPSAHKIAAGRRRALFSIVAWSMMSCCPGNCGFIAMAPPWLAAQPDALPLSIKSVCSE